MTRWQEVVGGTVCFGLVLTVLAGCGPAPAQEADEGAKPGALKGEPGIAEGMEKKGQPVSLVLYCGAGIRPAADAVIQAFEASHDVKIRPTYEGSEVLLGQLDASRKGDLFMPGAEPYVDRAIEKGLADGETKRIVAHFVPVIFVQPGNPKGILGLEDLGREGLRIGLGDERSCAVGKQMLKILEKNEMPYEMLQGNVHFKAATVNQLPMQVQLGNLDVVVCWDANARHFLKDGEMVEIPPEQNVPSSIPIVRLAFSHAPEEAMEFIEFIVSEQGRGILEEQGYTVSLGGDAEGTG